MYTRQQASIIRQEFWTTFGQYMSPVPSFDGLKVNWLNYKTGEKDIRFKLDADQQVAFVAIIISHKDPVVRQLYFEHLRGLKTILHEYTREEWEWSLDSVDENNTGTSKIFKEEQGLNIFNRQDWPAIIRFFKPRIIALDAFWSTVKDSFQSLS